MDKDIQAWAMKRDQVAEWLGISNLDIGACVSEVHAKMLEFQRLMAIENRLKQNIALYDKYIADLETLATSDGRDPRIYMDRAEEHTAAKVILQWILTGEEG